MHSQQLFAIPLASLFAASFVLSGDAMIQTGDGHLLACLWLLLLLLWLAFRNASLLRSCAAFIASSAVEEPRAIRKAGKKNEKKRRNLPNLPRDMPAGFPPIPIRWGSVDTVLLLFLLFYLFVSPCSRTGNNLFVTANILGAWLAVAAAWLLFRQILLDRTTIGAFLSILLALAVMQSFLAVWQEYAVHPRLLAEYQRDPEAILQAEGIAVDPLSGERRLFEARLRSATPLGTYLLTNTLGGQLAPVFLLALFFAVKSLRAQHHRLRKTAAFLPALMLLFVLFLTRCRSAFVAISFGLVLSVALSGSAKTTFVKIHGISRGAVRLFSWKAAAGILLCLILVSGCLFFMLGTQSGGSFLDGAKRSLGFRLEYWQASMRLIADHPLTGCGIGNFQQAYLRYKLPTASEEILDPHNFLIEITACGGIPAIMLFLCFLGIVFHRCVRPAPPVSDAVEPPGEAIQSPDRQLYGRFFAFQMAGAFFGVLFCVGVSMSYRVAIPPETMLIALPAFLLVYWLDPANVREGIPMRISPAMTGILLSTLLVHLLAAGGISYENTSVAIFLLAAILVNQTATPGMLPPRRIQPLAFLAAALLCFVYVTLFLPLPAAWNRFDASKLPDAPAAQIERLEKGMRGLYFVPYEFRLALVRARLLQWTSSRDEADRVALETEIERTARVAFDAPTVLVPLAGALEQIDSVMPDPKRRDTILALYDRAARLYPNQAKMHAPFAFALRKYGKPDEAADERDKAIALDDIMPHGDQKLPKPVRDELDRWNP
ncbi:MAG TPA: hypothetical protein DEB39_00780 [Planctomycetaceae bacterium]|nr:hypothetical protein [Planctomycetaceae bacterium]